VVLADAEEVHAQAVRQLRFGDHVAQHASVRQETAVGIRGDVAEGVEAQLDGWHGPVTTDLRAQFPCQGHSQAAPRTPLESP
jgi:hypothetical protein